MSKPRRIDVFVVTTGLGAFGHPAYAHGIEQLTPYLMWPAIVFGIVGGVIGCMRRVQRSAGLFNTLGLYLVAVFVYVLGSRSSLEEYSAVALGALLIATLGIIVGALPLSMGYVFAEWIAKRVTKRQQSKETSGNGS